MRKKKQPEKKIQEVPEEITPAVLGKGPVWIDGQLYMSPFDLTRYKLAEALLLNSASARALKRLEFERETQKFNKTMDQLFAEEVRRKNALVALQKELADLYPVSFSDANLTFDTDTGRLAVDGAPVLKPEQ